ncbi:MAG: hypothetical protein ACJAVV_003394 [Alphaproteobacteria bacterium]|jgi:hypothetical protein
MKDHANHLFSLFIKVSVPLCLLLFLVNISPVFAQAIKVEIVESNGGYSLLRDGEPYEVKGVGMVGINFESAAKYGANSIRTWSVDHNPISAIELLDRAHALGMTVSLCLEFARERQGFDYDDPAAVAQQFEESRERVIKYKDHPALLTWIIGNEVNFDYINPKVFDAVNQVAEMIKKVDPNHPSTTALAGFDKRALVDIAKRAPALDFVSFQMYADILNLPKYVKSYGYTKPFFVTEWGGVGHWEVFTTDWGAPVENTSSEKASNYSKSYRQVLQPYAGQALGNYVFLWGQKQEKTPTWYGMFLDSGEETEPVDVMHYIWNGVWPQNRSPSVRSIALDGKSPFDNVYLSAGKDYTAYIEVVEPDKDEVRIMWEVRKESTSAKVGGDPEYVPAIVDGLIVNIEGPLVTIKAPDETGAYRLFAYAYDDQGNAGHANFPFYVK